MLWFFILIFGLFSIFLVPVFQFYHQGADGKKELTGLEAELVSYEVGMLGNVGYSSVQCASIPVNVGQLSLSCPYGTIGQVDGKPLDYGINLG
jgi:hypothetical protein